MIPNLFKIYPGMKLKRWLFLIVISIVVILVGFWGLMGTQFRDFRVTIVPEKVVSDIAHQLQRLVFIDFVLILIGFSAVYLAVRRIVRNAITYFAPDRDDSAFQIFLKRNQLKKGPRIVALGGGTGLPALLHGLKEFTSNLTAVVTVSDDGGSSGRLRREFNVPPPGDIRNCLVALADVEPLMSELFQHRFRAKSSLDGHSFGNLFITAMTSVSGDFGQAIRESSKILAIRGQVLPVTLESVSLHARLSGGRIVHGESMIPRSRGRIERVFLKPEQCKPSEEVLDAIGKAQVIVMGPGSLYTSVLPNLIVPGIADAIARSRAIKVYVCNIMTQPGETDGYAVSDHVRALIEHTGRSIMDYVIVNTDRSSESVVRRYARERAIPVTVDEPGLRRLGVEAVKTGVLAEGDFIRHDPLKLGRAIMRLVII